MKTAICRLAVGLALVVTSVAGEPPTAVTVDVPEYEVVELGGMQEISIPGGRVLAAEEGRPIVPYWVETVSLPEGYRVQEVELVEQGKPRRDSGLVLLTVQPDEGPEVPARPGWFPGQDFSWRASYDAAPRLALAVFPFRYDPKSRWSEFRSTYKFSVRYARSSVRIADVRLEEPVVDPGETVVAWVHTTNAGPAAEVRLGGEVRRPWTDDPAAEIEPQTVTLGEADSSRLAWRSGRTATGEYELIITARDEAGNELDRTKTVFRLGNPKGEVTGFGVEPEQFELGDRLRLNLTFTNTGTCDIEGECVFRISESGTAVAELTEPMARTKPGTTRRFEQTWDTQDAREGAVYSATGFVRFAGTASEPRSATFSTNQAPRAGFKAAPETTSVGVAVSFDASESSDGDGSIAEYRWAFGDGGRGESERPTHVYQLPGEYRAVLTVVDNEGRSATAERVVVVIGEEE